MDEDIPKDNSSYVGALTSSGIMGSFPLLRAIDVQHDHHLVHPFQVHGLFLLGLATSHSCVASVQRDLASHASISLAPLVSSPSADSNGETDLPVIGSSDCLPS